MADIRQRKSKVDSACAEPESLQKQGEKIPDRLPITDPQSRTNPNKEAGFAPNNTPTVTVDIDSGLIVGTDIHTSPVEEKFMMGQITQVVESFSMEAEPKELLADGLICSGEKLAACKDRKIDLYSPIKLSVDSSNAAFREDLIQPVASELLDQLPILKTNHSDGRKTSQFHKNAFVYDADKDCYWCPNGNAIPHSRIAESLVRVVVASSCIQFQATHRPADEVHGTSTLRPEHRSSSL